jgi:uncharacterized membrane protein
MSTIINQFLSKYQYSNLQSEFQDNYESHPNYPSLFAITDTFSLLNIENVAANVPKDQLEELPDCFLGYIKNEDNIFDLGFIERKGDSIAITFEAKKKKIIQIDNFKELWNGVVIIIETNDVKLVKTNSVLQKIVLLAFGLLGLFFIKQEFNFSMEGTVSFVLYTIGFVISIFIIQEKLNRGNESVSKLCSFNENASCSSVINSSGAKINKWLDFSDLPILFFSVAIMTMLIDTTSYLILNILSLFSIPIVIYSVWLQKVKLQKWCMLCLAVSILLIFQGVLFFLSGELPKDISSLILATVLATTLWLFMKSNLEKSSNLEKNNKKLKKFKRNYSVFELLQKPLKTPLRAAIFSTVEIGSRLNPIKVSLALSPSCGHCHSAFEQAIKLFNSNPESIQLSIFFNLNIENKANPYLDIVKNIMQINQKDPEDVVEALSDWHIKRMSLLDWLFKWEQLHIEDEIIEDLQSQYEWCLQNDFNYTPVKMINESEYPREYDLEELKYFISEIEEIKRPLIMV